MNCMHLPEGIIVFIHEDLLVRDDIRVVDACQDTDLIDGVCSLFFTEVVDPDFLECVRLVIGLPRDSVYTRVSTRT